jgi:uncharacterized protein (DUF2225 family)
MKRSIVLTFTLVIILSGRTLATTWDYVSKKCPVCNSISQYLEPMSYGGYIYQWPSKYQYVYWPYTDDASFYCCPNCHYAAFMCDFDSIPNDKIDTIQVVLQSFNIDSSGNEYRQIPVTTRLEIAEKVYQLLGRDTKFWCRFYRIMGYHYAEENNHKKALESRGKALLMANEMLNDTAYSGQEKENLFIIASMFNYLNQKDSCTFYLNKANNCVYSDKTAELEYSLSLDEYLKDLIVEYREILQDERTKNLFNLK